MVLISDFKGSIFGGSVLVMIKRKGKERRHTIDKMEWEEE